MASAGFSGGAGARGLFRGVSWPVEQFPMGRNRILLPELLNLSLLLSKSSGSVSMATAVADTQPSGLALGWLR